MSNAGSCSAPHALARGEREKKVTHESGQYLVSCAPAALEGGTAGKELLSLIDHGVVGGGEGGGAEFRSRPQQLLAFAQV